MSTARTAVTTIPLVPPNHLRVIDESSLRERKWPARGAVVERRRHINDIVGWRGKLLRWYFVYGGRTIYFLLHLPIPDVHGIYKEFQNLVIADTEEEVVAMAEEMLEDESYYFQVGPVNEPSPKETCQVGLQRMAKHGAKILYNNRKLSNVSVPREKLEFLESRLHSLSEPNIEI